jgi:hypothetical protein
MQYCTKLEAVMLGSSGKQSPARNANKKRADQLISINSTIKEKRINAPERRVETEIN